MSVSPHDVARQTVRQLERSVALIEAKFYRSSVGDISRTTRHGLHYFPTCPACIANITPSHRIVWPETTVTIQCAHGIPLVHFALCKDPIPLLDYRLSVTLKFQSGA